MRILIAHVAYEHRGGEDVVVENESSLLGEAGHEVSLLVVPSSDFHRLSKCEQLRIALNMGDHAHGRALVRAAIEEHHPDVVHFHNLYPLLGCGAIAEAASLGCATVQTLHNYRLSCIAGTHFRNGRVCERCRPGHHSAGVVRGCYRGSRAQSLAMARGVAGQWQMLSRQGLPHGEVCLTDFMRDRLIGFGAGASVLHVKPNSVGAREGADWAARRGAVFVGRLSAEKGILELVEAWGSNMAELRIVGDGPLVDVIRERSRLKPNVWVVGRLSGYEVTRVVGDARVLVLPSIWWEGGYPLVAQEALGVGTPIVAYALGAMAPAAEVGEELLVEPAGDAAALARAANSVCSMSENEWQSLSAKAAQLHEKSYSASANLQALMSLYSELIAGVRANG